MPAAPFFNPAPPLTDALLASLADPSTSFTQLAAANNTSLEALSLWITRPDIAQRLEAIHHIAAVRTRFIAANLVPQSLGALDRVLKHTTTQITFDAAADSDPSKPQRTPEQRQRTIETCRRAASRIVSLVNFKPLPLFSVPRASLLLCRNHT